MNTSTITKSALALALGLCATGAMADSKDAAREDFQGDAFANGVNTVATNNLTWADTEGYSAVSAGKLVVDATTNAPTSATLATDAANSVNGAINAAGRTASFEAKVSFTPATDTPDIGGSDLRFALYAKAGSGSTNLVVYTGSETVTATEIAANTETTVKVDFTAANTFQVYIGGNLVAGGPFAFANNGTISKVEFAGNGEVDDLVFSYDLAPVNLSWPTSVSVASYTINGNAGDALTAGAGSATVYGDVGDAIVLTIQNADGVTKTFTGTVGTDATIGNSAYAYTWADYLGAAVDGAYEIDNLAELKLFQKGIPSSTNEVKLATAGETFKLTADIALDAAWPGIGVQNGKDIYSTADFNAAAFQGTFDGQNHTISGFQMIGKGDNPEGLDYCGFFNSTYDATIQNLKIAYAGSLFAADTTSSTKESGATFVGVAKNSTLRNLTTVAGTVSCSKGFGGIVGYLTSGSLVESCTNNVNMTSLASNKAGGIAMITQGGSAVTIRNCQNNGTTAGNAGQKGGIVGYVGLDTTIDSCEDTASSTPSFFHRETGTVTMLGVNKASESLASYTAGVVIDGLAFATVDNGVATFVKNADLALNGNYKVMGPNATATFNFTTTGTIAFDEALVAPTYAITGATGLTVTPSTSGTVKTYTATVTQYAVTVSGDTSNLTATWTVNGNTVSAPATLNHGDSYSVTFAPATGYAIKEGETTTFSGTATAAVAITAPEVEALPSYEEHDDVTVNGGTHELTAAEASYLNTLVGNTSADAVESALASIDEEDFVAATLLNQDITDNDFDGANSYSFDITKISKSGSTVTVTVKLVRNANVDVLGAIQGTAKLYTCDTPNGTYTEAGVAAISFPATTTGEQTGTATFTGVNKFFKVVIE